MINLALLFGIANSFAWMMAFIALSLGYFIYEPTLWIAITEAILAFMMLMVGAVALWRYNGQKETPTL